jgi:sulfhydrogenase subunit alpha
MSDSDKPKKIRSIKVDYLARVEGEGAMQLHMKDGAVEDVKLKIFEPPRFFEAFLQGRSYSEAPDITARICGICPVAYQMSACHAVERAAGVLVDGPLRELRRLLYCGEWIESHGLHVFMLHAPDFLGYESAIEMAKDHKDVLQMGLQLKKVGNEIGTFLGGREIHPVNVKVGGFYKTPFRTSIRTMSSSAYLIQTSIQ